MALTTITQQEITQWLLICKGLGYEFTFQNDEAKIYYLQFLKEFNTRMDRHQIRPRGKAMLNHFHDTLMDLIPKFIALNVKVHYQDKLVQLECLN